MALTSSEVNFLSWNISPSKGVIPMYYPDSLLNVHMNFEVDRENFTQAFRAVWDSSVTPEEDLPDPEFPSDLPVLMASRHGDVPKTMAMSYLDQNFDEEYVSMVYSVWKSRAMRLADAIALVVPYTKVPAFVPFFFTQLKPQQVLVGLLYLTKAEVCYRHPQAINFYNTVLECFPGIYRFGLRKTLGQCILDASDMFFSMTSAGACFETEVDVVVTKGFSLLAAGEAISHPFRVQTVHPRQIPYLPPHTLDGKCQMHNMELGDCGICAAIHIMGLEPSLVEAVPWTDSPLFQASLELLDDMMEPVDEDAEIQYIRDTIVFNKYTRFVEPIQHLLYLPTLLPTQLENDINAMLIQLRLVFVQSGLAGRPKAAPNTQVEYKPLPSYIDGKTFFKGRTMQGFPNFQAQQEKEAELGMIMLTHICETIDAYKGFAQEIISNPICPGETFLVNTLLFIVKENHMRHEMDDRYAQHAAAALGKLIRNPIFPATRITFLLNLWRWFISSTKIDHNIKGIVQEPFLSALNDLISDHPTNDTTATVVVNAILSLLEQHVTPHLKDIRRTATVVSTATGLAISIYNVIRCSLLPDIPKDLLILNGLLIACSAFSLYSAIVEKIESAVFDFLRESMTSIVNDVIAPGTSSTDHIYEDMGTGDVPTNAAMPKICVKLVSVLALGITKACGFSTPLNLLKDAGIAFKAADATTEAVSEFLSEVFDIDTTGVKAEQALVTDLECRGQELLDLTGNAWADTKVLSNVEAWLNLANATIRKPSKQRINMARLTSLCLDISKRLSEIHRIRTTGQARPVPVAIWIWGEPGHGKTEFVNQFLIPHLSRVFGVPEDTFNLQSGKYAMPIVNQRWAVYDEAGAMKTVEDHVLGRLNNLLSGAPCVLPGADVENKNQVANFNAVFFMSNRPPAMVDFGMNEEAKRALITRLWEYELIDPHYDPTKGREGQTHRRADFSHLTIRGVNTATGAMEEKTPADLVRKAVENIVINTNQYRATQDGQYMPAEVLVDELSQILPEGFELPTPYIPVIKDLPTAATPFCCSFSGAAGSRKTTQWLPELIGAFKTLGFIEIQLTKETTIKMMCNKEPAQRAIWVIDDQYDLSNDQDCQELLRKMNAVSPEDIIIFSSNYGPARMFWTKAFWTGPSYHEVTLEKYPGLIRRLGFDKTHPESINVTVTKTDAFVTGGQAYSVPYAVSRYLSYINKMEFVDMVEKVPEHLPFTRDEADIWINIPENIQISSVTQLMEACHVSFKCLPMVTRLAPDLIGKRDWFLILQRKIMNGYAQGIKDLKIYGRVPGKVFMFYKNTFYVDQNNTDYMLRFDDAIQKAYIVSTVYEGGEKLIHRDHYVSIRAVGGPLTTSEEDTAIFLTLQKLRAVNDDLWQKMSNSGYYRLTTMELTKTALFNTKQRLIRWATWLRNHWQIGAVLGLLCVAIPVLYRIFRKEKPLPARTEVFISRCEFCAKGNLCPVFHTTDEMIREDRIVYTARNGGRGRMSRAGAILKNPKKFSFNNQFYVVSGADTDFSENHTVERLYHDFHRRLQNGDLEERDDHYYVDLPAPVGKAYARLSKAGGDWEIHMNADVPTSDTNLDCYTNNILRGAQGCLTFTVTMLDGSMGVTSAHCVTHPGSFLEVYQDDKEHTAVVLSKDTEHELAFICIVNKRTSKAKVLSGMADLTRLLSPRNAIPSTGHCTVVTRRNNHFGHYTSKYTIMTVPYPNLSAERLQSWKEFAGVVSYGTTIQPVKVGDSGAPVFALTKEGPRLIGIQAAVRQMLCQYIFAVVCNEVLATKATAAEDVPVSPQPFQDVTSYQMNESHAQVLIHQDFASKIRAQKAFPMYLEGNSYQFGTVRNHLPIDTSNDRVPIDSFQFSPVFGNLKSPALPVLEVELKHSDKIPPDSHGLRAATHIKMQKLSSSHIVKDLDQGVAIKAGIALAEYYKMKYGVSSVKPLSVDKAINGTTPDKKLEVDSSTGAAFQILHPGFPTKATLLEVDAQDEKGIHRVFNKTKAAQWTKATVEEQWAQAKKGTLLCLPASASFKAELLPKEKTWKKRIVYVVDTPTVLNQKRLLQPLMDILTSDGPLSDFQLSMNPYRDFDGIARKLQRISTDGLLSLDFKDFDLSIPGDLLIAAAHFVAEFYPVEEVGLRKACIALIGGIGSTPILVGENIYGKNQGMLSGVYGTSLLDSICAKILLYHIYSVVTGADELAAVDEFFDNVATVGCGDDTTVSVSSQCRGVFNFESIRDQAKEIYDMTITSDLKDGEAGVFTTISGASFCSRKWIPIPGHPNVLGSQLKREAMSGAMCWSKLKNPQDQLIQLEALRPEFVGWGKELYLQFEVLLREFCSKYDLDYKPILWDTLCEEAWQAVVAAPMLGNKRQELPSLEPQKKINFNYKEIAEKIEELCGPPDMACLCLKDLPTKSQFSTVKDVFQLANTLAEFRSSGLAKSLAEEDVPTRQVLRKVPVTDEPYYITDPVSLIWYQQTVVGFPSEELQGFQILARSDPPPRTGRKFRVFLADKRLAQALSNVLNHPHSSHYFTLLLAILRGEATSGRGKPSGGTQGTTPQTRAAAVTGGGPSISSVQVPSGVSVQDAPVQPESVATTGPAPAVMAMAPGIDGRNADQLGYFRDLSSYLFEFYPTTELTATTSTSSGTLLAQWDFDPWDENLVGQMVARYASFHTHFVGGLALKFSIPSIGFVTGRFIWYYVPGPFVDSTPVNKFDLFKYQHFVHEITNTTGLGSEGEILIMPASNSEFTVQRSKTPGGTYGRLYLMSFTQVQNSYGANSTLPIQLYGSLAVGSSFANPGDPLSTAVDVPEMPAVGRTLVIDGVYPYPAPEVPADPENVEPRGTASIESYKPIFRLISGTGYVTVADTGITEAAGCDAALMGLATTGDIYSQVYGQGMRLYLPKTDPYYVPTEVKAQASYTGATVKIDGWHIYGNTDAATPAATKITISTSGQSVAMVKVATTISSSATTQNKYLGSPLKTADGLKVHTTRLVGITGGTVKLTGLPTGLVKGIYNFPDFSATVSGALIAESGMTFSSRVGIPSNYKRIELVDTRSDLPAVNQIVQGCTIPPEYDSLDLQLNERKYFAANPSIKSIITTLRSGADTVVVVRNSLGWWIYAPTTPDYATWDSLPPWKQTHEVSAVMWPVVPSVRSTGFKTRYINTTSTAAFMVGGVLAGLGSGIASYAQNKQEMDWKKYNLAATQQFQAQQLQFNARVNAANLQYTTESGLYMQGMDQATKDFQTQRAAMYQAALTKTNNDFQLKKMTLNQGVQAFQTVGGVRASTIGTELSPRQGGLIMEDDTLSEDYNRLGMIASWKNPNIATVLTQNKKPTQPVIPPAPKVPVVAEGVEVPEEEPERPFNIYEPSTNMDSSGASDLDLAVFGESDI